MNGNKAALKEKAVSLRVKRYELYQSRNPVIRWISKRYLKKIRDILKRIDAPSLMGLDIGCGAGHLVWYLKKEGTIKDMVAIDLDEENLRYAKKHHPLCQYLMADINESNFRKDTFDYIIATEIFEHLRHPAKAIRELRRVSKDNSPIIISIPHEPFFHWGNLLRGKWRDRGGRTPFHLNFWNHWQFRNFLSKFAEIEEEYCTATFPWSLYVARFKKDYRICSSCVCDTTIPNIRFDDKGVCNFCKTHHRLEKRYPLNEEGKKRLNRLIDKIKHQGKDKRYDCILGVSGGTDSTYSLYMAKRAGLRPLAVHFDNGWDTDIAINNIKNATERLGVDLKMVRCDWEEFKDVQLSFLKASVSEAEVPTDIAITSALCRAAVKEGIGYVISGHSFRSEGLAPIGWTYMDGRYIQSVQKKFGNLKLRSFPNLTISDLLYYTFVKKIRVIPLLNYLEYSKEGVRKILQKKLGWTYYGGHHFENIYTYFVIVYILLNKFNIDKRIINFSAHIRSGFINRDEALERLKEKPKMEQKIVDHCIERLGLTPKEFEKILSLEPKTFLDYSTYYPMIKALRFPIKLVCKLNLIPQLFYEKYLG